MQMGYSLYLSIAQLAEPTKRTWKKVDYGEGDRDI
jgi:hypothetical protein